MSKKFKIAHVNQPLEESPPQVNWTLCVLCQKDSGEELTVPENNNKKECSYEGYKTLANNLAEFYLLGQVPLGVCVPSLDDGSGVFETFVKNKARWHKKCYLHFSRSRLERAEKRARERPDLQSTPSPVKTRKVAEVYAKGTCIFCGLREKRSQALSRVSTFNCHKEIMECATARKDTTLLAKAEGATDLIALDAMYHNRCRVSYLNRKRSMNRDKEGNGVDQLHGLALAGVVSYMNSVRLNSDSPPVFKVAELAREYADGMKDLGVQCSIHSTRFRERLLEECPDLEYTGEPGQDGIVSFRKDVDASIRSDCAREYDSEGYTLTEAADILRTDMFQHPSCDWSEMSAECQASCVPASLKAFVKMVLNGPASRPKDAEDNCDQIVLTIAQLLSYHAVKRSKQSIVRRHDKSRETPAPVYVASKIYGETRKKDLVDMCFKMGLSISYDRLKTILTERANQACERYHVEGAVCPLSLKRGIFSTAAVDNIDHNTTSTTAKDAFHGTAISIMQHPTTQNQGEDRPPMPQSENTSWKKRTISELPADYSVVSASFLNGKFAKCPPSRHGLVELCTDDEPLIQEKEWLEGATTDQCVTWAAYHSQKEDTDAVRCKTNIAVLPVFYEQAHTMSMMLHAMNVVRNAVKLLSPQQITVLVADQPLFALCKQIQFLVPDTHGDAHFFILMGGLHVEMAALRALGHWLDGSGWIQAIVDAGITTQGRAESMLRVSHVTRTRYAHQVTAAALYSLQKEAYSLSGEGSDDPQTFEEWKTERCRNFPQFRYWEIVLRMVLAVLQIVRAVRTGDFDLYVSSLVRFVPWFFALDQTNYARWLPIHIRDLVSVRTTQPELYAEFKLGHFVARKTSRPFSAIALDQAHEQVNALLKGDGGMVGLTQDADALRKWMLAGPEMAELVSKFESNFSSPETGHLSHHDVSKATQTRFLRDRKALEEVIRDMGNPFLEESGDLYRLDTKQLAPEAVVTTVLTIEEKSVSLYESYVKERLETNDVGIMEPIKQNKFPLFSSSGKQCSGRKAESKIQALKNDCSLFSRLYIATCANRPGELSDFFAHENQQHPPSLSTQGEMRSGDKADLVKCLLKTSDSSVSESSPQVTAKFLDGAAIVHMLKPGMSRNFQEYVDKVFSRYIQSEATGVSRLDIVFDRYKADSLKAETREKRGKGNRTKVTPGTKIPKSWENFLREPENKSELFHLLARTFVEFSVSGVFLCATLEEDIVSNPPHLLEREGLSPCNHEEADTRILVHIHNAVKHGHSKVMIRTCDTDVLVLAVMCACMLDDLKEIWVHLGTGKRRQYVAAHEIARALGPQKSAALPAFHALTGCDTVSFFYGIGKLTAFRAWSQFPMATDAFALLLEGEVDQAMDALEKFVVTMYSRSVGADTVNECRKILFTKHDRQLESLPPTQDALKQHARRAALQAQIWHSATVALPEILDPEKFGWKRSAGRWSPVWITEPVAAEATVALIRCKCTKGCSTMRCKCKKNGLVCCELCSCDCSSA